MTSEPPIGPPAEPPSPPPAQPPVPYPQPLYGAPAYGGPAYGAPAYGAIPPPSAADRLRSAWQQRPESDYSFDFWTALGWMLLTCGIYTFYVTYQLVRRSRDHNRRRIAFLEAATSIAWETAQTRGISAELEPNFARISSQLAVLQQQDREFRDPIVWTLISLVASTIVHVILFILLDGDLNVHDLSLIHI